MRAAPVLPTPTSAPRTAVAPALPVFEPQIYQRPVAAPPLAATSPIIIGQVQSAPAATPAKLPPAAVVTKLAPATSPTAAGSGSWALNIASYSEAAVAEREVARLRAAGYASALSQPATINGKSWHRVQIGGYASEGSARAAALELKARLGVQNIWVLKP